MNKYRVLLQEVNTHEYIVEANNESEAEALAQNQYGSGEDNMVGEDLLTYDVYNLSQE
jgi:hypothetical protein